MSEITEINCKKFCVTINNSRNSNQDIISELYYFLEDNYIFSILIDNFNVKISYERNHLYFKFGSFIEDYNKYLEVMDIIYRMFKDLYNEGKLSDIVFDDEKKNDEISLLNAIYKDKEEFEEKKIEFYERVEKLESVGLLKYLQKHDNRIFEFLKVLREYVDDNKDTFEKDYDPNFIDESKIIISEKKLKYIYADKKNSDVVMIKFVNNNDDFNSIDAKCLCEYFVEESCNECCIHTYSLAKKILEKYDYNKKM